MSNDTYSATYDAVRSKLGYCDLASAVAEVCRSSFDISRITERMQESVYIHRNEMLRPSVVMRPQMFMDGNQWCCLYGEHLQDGVAGFGDSPALAAEAFDRAWCESLPKSSPGAAA